MSAVAAPESRVRSPARTVPVVRFTVKGQARTDDDAAADDAADTSTADAGLPSTDESQDESNDTALAEDGDSDRSQA